MTPEERKIIIKAARRISEENGRRFQAWAAAGYNRAALYQSLPWPPGFNDITCEAKTRAGTPCKQKAIYLNGRCKLHGGMSTGPKTAEGKETAARNGENGRRGKRTP